MINNPFKDPSGKIRRGRFFLDKKKSKQLKICFDFLIFAPLCDEMRDADKFIIFIF